MKGPALTMTFQQYYPFIPPARSAYYFVYGLSMFSLLF